MAPLRSRYSDAIWTSLSGGCRQLDPIEINANQPRMFSPRDPRNPLGAATDTARSCL
jgi:hypothetical protein